MKEGLTISKKKLDVSHLGHINGRVIDLGDDTVPDGKPDPAGSRVGCADPILDQTYQGTLLTDSRTDAAEIDEIVVEVVAMLSLCTSSIIGLFGGIRLRAALRKVLPYAAHDAWPAVA
jgi:hypothetical protein